MEKRTKFLILTGVIVILGLFVIIAIDHREKLHDQQSALMAKMASLAIAETHEVEVSVKPVHNQEALEIAVKAEDKVKTVAKKDDALVAPVAVAPSAQNAAITALIKMDNPAYSKHKKAIVVFTHLKHYQDYKIGCGDCHHDNKGVPLDLKPGDDVQSCIACHKIPKRPKGASKLSKEERLEFHAEAVHMNCINCHKKYNKENKTKAAPQSCGKCHLKKK